MHIVSDGRSDTWHMALTVKHRGGTLMIWGCMSTKGVGEMGLIRRHHKRLRIHQNADWEVPACVSRRRNDDLARYAARSGMCFRWFKCWRVPVSWQSLLFCLSVSECSLGSLSAASWPCPGSVSSVWGCFRPWWSRTGTDPPWEDMSVPVAPKFAMQGSTCSKTQERTLIHSHLKLLDYILCVLNPIPLVL